MKKVIILTFIAFLGFSNAFSGDLTPVSDWNAFLAARAWVALINRLPLDDNTQSFTIRSLETVSYQGHILCTVYHLSPRGHILVPAFHEFPPVKSFSIVSGFDTDSPGYEFAVLSELKAAFMELKEAKPASTTGLLSALGENREEWTKLLTWKPEELNTAALLLSPPTDTPGIQDFALRLNSGASIEGTQASPLINSHWDQDGPFWNFCPTLGGKRCYVGCVATAMSQIMRYYRWPDSGTGTHSYYWRGGNRNLSANFSDSYDWAYMPLQISAYDTNRERNAVAELCYEAGVAVDMGYGTRGSGAYTSDVAAVLKTYFKYSPQTRVVWRSDYSNRANWFQVFKNQRDASRPVQFAMYTPSSGHSVIIDGYLSTNTADKVHINMGWGGSYDAYYTLDNILSYTKEEWQLAVIDIIPKRARIELNKSNIAMTGTEGRSFPLEAAFKVHNAGSGVLNYRISANRNWISIRPSRGTSSGEWDRILVQVDLSSLLEGGYSGMVTVSAGDPYIKAQELSLQLTVKPPPIYAPQNFTAQQTWNRSLLQSELLNHLSWRPNPDNKHITHYRIYQIEGSSRILVAELSEEATSFLHKNITAGGTTHYQIVAVDYKNREGEPASISVS